MTESEWLSAISPHMVSLVARPYKRSNRKLRLYACACCRRIWHLLSDCRFHAAVEIAETFADGIGKLSHANTAAGAASRAVERDKEASKAEKLAASAVCVITGPAPARAARVGSSEARSAIRDDGRPGAYHDECAAQVLLLRDIFGNPFRPIPLPPEHRTPGVVSLVRAAYDERQLPSGELDTQRLAVLSDALEETGCDDVDILNHLRSPGPHVRGCWALDLCLGRS